MDFVRHLITASPLILVGGYMAYIIGRRTKNKKIELLGRRIYISAGSIFLIWLVVSMIVIIIFGMED